MTTQENMLARHSILHELGRGAIGAVYAARDRTTGASVALKRLDPELLKSDANLAERFLKHARTARRLEHRHIAKVHDAGGAAGTAYVAMEMLEGESLRKVLDRGPLPVARAIRTAHEIASGLAHAHLEGVIHGGLKPSNIIALRSGVVKITDFGIGQAALLSRARADCLSYLSPEQLRGDAVDHRCDLFSFGALFYEMLTGRRPFQGDSPQAVLQSILQAKLPPPSELNPHVPRALDPIVLSLLAAQPATRMPGFPVMLEELQRVAEGLGLETGASAVADEPTASVPPAKPDRVQIPDPSAPSSAAEGFQHRQITDREFLEIERAMRQRAAVPVRPSRSRAPVFVALALVLTALGIGLTKFAGLTDFSGVTAFMDDWSSRIQQAIAASRTQKEPVTAAQISPPTAPSPVAEVPRDIAPAPALAPAPLPKPERVVAPAPKLSEPVVAAPAQRLKPAVPSRPKVQAQKSGGMARLVVEVSPRGELYIDGKDHGTTPPITTLDLEPGMHRIEVRNGSRTPYLTYMTVAAGDVRRIRYDFNAKPIHPPR